MSDETIRFLCAEDIDRVMEIEKVCFPEPWEKEAFLSDIRDNMCARYIGFFRNEQLIGYAGVWFVMEEAHVVNVAVEPAAQRTGVGEKLMRALIQLCADTGEAFMTLECRRSNLAAQALYHKLNFIDVGYRRHYYANNEDALVMVLLQLPEPCEENDPFLITEDDDGETV